jgi:hypothetical protein
MQAPYYRHDLDWVALDANGEMVASACLWLDPATGVVLVEPIGAATPHALIAASRRNGVSAARP